MNCPACGHENNLKAVTCALCETAFEEGYYEETGNPYSQLYSPKIEPKKMKFLPAILLMQGLGSFLTPVLYPETLKGSSNAFPLIALSVTIALVVLAFLAGLGLYLNKKWGWWLASFYYTYGIFRLSLTMIFAFIFLIKGIKTNHGPFYYILKYSLKLSVSIMFLIYLFSSDILNRFDLSELNKSKTILRFAGIVILIILATNLSLIL